MHRKEHSGNCWFPEPLSSFEMAGTVQFLMVNSLFSIAFLLCQNKEEMLILEVFANQKLFPQILFAVFYHPRRTTPKPPG